MRVLKEDSSFVIIHSSSIYKQNYNILTIIVHTRPIFQLFFLLISQWASSKYSKTYNYQKKYSCNFKRLLKRIWIYLKGTNFRGISLLLSSLVTTDHFLLLLFLFLYLL